jgi:hypothetical protein
MTDMHRLLEEFIAEDRSGVADPALYLARVSGVDRSELEALIDAYLARASRRAFDRAAFESSPARGVAASLAGSSGTWPALLPRLRHRAQLRRAEVVSRLAAALGAADREAKVAGYYHAMEQGTLPAAGVNDRVLEALGRIVGESTEVLRTAGQATHSPPRLGGAAFARVASPAPEFASPPAAAAPPAPRAERDEIDDLFTGR